MEATGLAVRARGLRKSYGGVEAVSGVDLEIPPGEVFSLLGPNGAGKTTTVEILEGYRRRDGGEVSVLGTDPQHAGRAWRARIGIVLQLAADAPELTVAEMISHFAGFYPCPRRPAEVIDMVGLTGKARARIHTLSGGQLRRLDVALGLIGRPELLFLDEPTTGFDPEARRAFWEVIRVLSGSGVTVLLTTHYLDEAAALADRVAVIRDGVIVAEGTPAGLGGRAAAEAVVSWQDRDRRRSERTVEPTRVVAALAARYDGFISGVYVPFFLVPPWLRDVASVFPLEWMCQGMRSVFVPQAVTMEPGNSWQHGQTAVVLLAWVVAGLVLCLTTFRWRSRQDAWPAALRERGHRQDAPAARLRQAWRLRPASARLRMARPL